MVWLVIGVLLTLLVIPTTAYATAALKFAGIEGTSTNKADVTPAGQLLTTESQPSNYEDYSVQIGDQCYGLTRIPSGDAFIAEQVEVVVTQTVTASSFSSGGQSEVASNSNFKIVADNP